MQNETNKSSSLPAFADLMVDCSLIKRLHFTINSTGMKEGFYWVNHNGRTLQFSNSNSILQLLLLLNDFANEGEDEERENCAPGQQRATGSDLIATVNCHSSFSHQCCPPPWTNIPPRQFCRELSNHLSSSHSQLKPSIVQTFSSPSSLNQCPAHTSHISPHRPCSSSLPA